MRRSKTIQITAILSRLDAGDSEAVDRLFEVVYEELRGMAQKKLGAERPDHTLQPTALVHEAYLRLVDQSRVDWKGRTHFFAVGASAMRRILIDHARRRQRHKRGGAWQRVTLDERIAPIATPDIEVVSLQEALEKLAALDPRQARIVEMRFFGGLTVQEVAEVLEVSKRTIEGEWTHAKAWLRRELDRGEAS